MRGGGRRAERGAVGGERQPAVRQDVAHRSLASRRVEHLNVEIPEPLRGPEIGRDQHMRAVFGGDIEAAPCAGTSDPIAAAEARCARDRAMRQADAATKGISSISDWQGSSGPEISSGWPPRSNS